MLCTLATMLVSLTARIFQECFFCGALLSVCSAESGGKGGEEALRGVRTFMSKTHKTCDKIFSHFLYSLKLLLGRE